MYQAVHYIILNLYIDIIVGINYQPGGYNVTIKKGRRESEKFSIPVNGSDRYTGNRKFGLLIAISPSTTEGFVFCPNNEVEVTILDNECK